MPNRLQGEYQSGFVHWQTDSQLADCYRTNGDACPILHHY